jgi:Holliday junction resolvasome RuvABC endonuclease subunit
MGQTQIKIYTDEDVASAVAKALRRRGSEVSTTPEHGNFELTDEEQLEFATSIGAAILTHNVQDFPRIHYEFMEKGLSHKGVIVAKQVSIAEMVKRLLRLAAKLTAEDMEDRLEYLSNW